MEIKTKFNIGDKVYWLNERDGIYRISNDTISSINITGYYYTYKVSFRDNIKEAELFTDFEEARKIALLKQEEFNKDAIGIIEKYKKPFLA